MPITGHRGHGWGVWLQRHSGVGKVHVGEQVVQWVPAPGWGQADKWRVATLGKHCHGCHLSGLCLLMLPGGPQDRFYVSSTSGISKDLAVRGRRILHQNCFLIARWLSTSIVIHCENRSWGTEKKNISNKIIYLLCYWTLWMLYNLFVSCSALGQKSICFNVPHVPNLFFCQYLRIAACHQLIY